MRDVQVGGTCLVEVPHALPRDRWPWDPWDPRMWLRMVWLRGRRFALSITELDRAERMVTGERMVDQDMVTVQLTDEQVAGVGLPPGQYWLEGTLLDSEHHRVALPAVEQLRVPTARSGSRAEGGAEATAGRATGALADSSAGPERCPLGAERGHRRCREASPRSADIGSGPWAPGHAPRSECEVARQVAAALTVGTRRR